MKIAFVCARVLAPVPLPGRGSHGGGRVSNGLPKRKKIDKKQLTSGAAWCIIRAYKGHGDPERMEVKKTMKKLNELKTSRQIWHGVALYTSAEEATVHGFALMYEDKRGNVYGIRNAEAVAAGNFGKWDKIAFVPGSEYMEEYAAQAFEIHE